MASRLASPNARPIWAGNFEIPGEWADRALCKDSGHPDAWFPEKAGPGDIVSTTFAKAICRRCPVRNPCLQYALRHESGVYRWGVYGGLSPEERRKLAGRLKAV